MRNLLFAPLKQHAGYNRLVNSLAGSATLGLFGLSDSQRAHMLTSIMRDTDRPMLVIVQNDLAAQRLLDDMLSLTDGTAMLLPAREISFYRVAAVSNDLSIRRLDAMGKLLEGKTKVIIAPIDAMLNRVMPRSVFEESIIRINEGDIINLRDLVKRLVNAGYERVDVVEGHGQCALRGGILDVFPIGSASAVRIEFFDDEVDSIRELDVLTQRSVIRCKTATMYPAREVVLPQQTLAKAIAKIMELCRQPTAVKYTAQPAETAPWDDEDTLPDLWSIEPDGDNLRLPLAEEPKVRLNHADFVLESLKENGSFDGAENYISILYDATQSILDYMDNPIVIVEQPEKLKERCFNLALEFDSQFTQALERDEAFGAQGSLLLSFDEIMHEVYKHTCIVAATFTRGYEGIKFSDIFSIEGMSATAYQGNLDELAVDIANWKRDGWRVALLAGGVARGQRLEKSLVEENQIVPFVEEHAGDLVAGEVIILPDLITHGFIYPEIKFAVVSDGDMLGVGKQRQSSHRGRNVGEKLAAFTDLKVGNYVVHESHGIGQYMGTVRMQSEGTYRDYLLIQYSGSDKLYVPTEQLDKVQKFIGAENAAPRINKLSGGEWQKQKARVKAAIKDIAEELVKLYAQRQSVKGHAFLPDTPWQREFEDNFPFEETPDQLQSIAEIKADMERPQVMDRLLCGDVGYGKTEVALRAAFKAVMDGKQVALLAPTTILTQQHYNTIRRRFDGFPIQVEMVSRFRTPQEQKQIFKRLKEGDLDILVGTHKLLSKDVVFKNLGLLVVDEEQRFGVQHKESIKKMKQNVDVLTLSATPIPRTLHMSMVGIRDMSLLESPPEERYPVQTYVVEYSDSLIRDAIMREIGRKGQVYFLYNRVATIDKFHEKLKQLVPEARIAVGHGQMRDSMLEDVMLDFYDGSYDVLLCSTIIESGLDVPTANTLIVYDADRFGLSQLYQLRGRVGRSNRLAYAYLTIRKDKVLGEVAEKRLKAIKEFTEFGSGFKIAMRDLEIRGAGNLLGSQQHGHLSTVGYDMYCKLIEESVREVRGELFIDEITTRVEIRVDAFLPGEYIANDLQRIEIYKKIALVDSRASREDMEEELTDRFGDPTRPVLNLIDIAHLKALCTKLQIDNVVHRQGQLQMRFAPQANLDLLKLMQVVGEYKKSITFSATEPPCLIILQGSMDADQMLHGAVGTVEKIVKGMGISC